MTHQNVVPRSQIKYTYYLLEFKDCPNVKGLDEPIDYAICKDFNEVRKWLFFADLDLDDTDGLAEIKIKGIGLTRKQYRDYKNGNFDLTEYRKENAS